MGFKIFSPYRHDERRRFRFRDHHEHREHRHHRRYYPWCDEY